LALVDALLLSFSFSFSLSPFPSLSSFPFYAAELVGIDQEGYEALARVVLPFLPPSFFPPPSFLPSFSVMPHHGNRKVCEASSTLFPLLFPSFSPPFLLPRSQRPERGDKPNLFPSFFFLPPLFLSLPSFFWPAARHQWSVVSETIC